MNEHEIKIYEAKIIVRLQKQVLDPQGDSVKAAINALGISEIKTIRQGKIFDAIIQAPTKDKALEIAKNISHKLLINELIENCEIEIKEHK